MAKGRLKELLPEGVRILRERLEVMRTHPAGVELPDDMELPELDDAVENTIEIEP